MFYSTIFSGGGGADWGLKMAGLEGVWGIEKCPAISELYQVNFGHSPYGDLLELNPRNFERPDFLHISPPCINFSRAKNNAAEQGLDRALAERVQDFIEYLLPDYISIENVPEYAKSQAFTAITTLLQKLDYTYAVDVVDASWFGVPQNRNRLIVRATRSKTEIKPLKNYRARPYPIPSWYQALADLIPCLPPSTLTANQKQAIEHLTGQILVERVGYRARGCQTRLGSQPCWTIRAALGDDGHGGNRNKVIDAIVDNSVYSLNARALARLQSFTDDYLLPPELGANKLYRAIGNAVPPLLMHCVVESLVSGT